MGSIYLLFFAPLPRVSGARGVSKSLKIKKARDHFCNYSGKCLFLLLIIIIIVGLWPLNFFPKNHVKIDSTTGVNLGRPGTAYTSLPPNKLRNPSAFTVAICLTTDSSGLTGFENILGYAAAAQESNFILGQWKDGLGLHLQADGRSQEIHFGEYGVLRKGQRVCCLISCNGEALTLYENGKIKKKRTGSFIFSEWVDSYPLVIGTDGNGQSQWGGTIHEIAIYDRALTSGEGEGYKDRREANVGGGQWSVDGERNKIKVGERQEATGQRKREGAEDTRPVIHYVFKPENTYETTFRGQKAIGVRDLGKGRAADLVITGYFTPYKRAFLEKPSKNWKDYHRNIIEDMLVNLFGFVPLGVLLFMKLERKGSPRVFCVTFAVAVGFAVSLTIEVLQAFLPTRNSSMLDLIMNSTGTLLGACYMAVVGKRLQRNGCRQQNYEDQKQQAA